MAIPAEASDLSVARTEFDALGIAQHRLARWFAVSVRSVRRWQAGDRCTPCGVAILMRLLAAGAVSVEEVEAVVAIPARTNGSAKPGAPAPLLGEPAPEQSALARTKAATHADPGLTTAEKVCALTPEVCCWPCGDPGHPLAAGMAPPSGSSLMGGDRRPRSGCQQECQQERPRTAVGGSVDRFC
jgi:hypothetical protein